MILYQLGKYIDATPPQNIKVVTDGLVASCLKSDTDFQVSKELWARVAIWVRSFSFIVCIDIDYTF